MVLLAAPQASAPQALELVQLMLLLLALLLVPGHCLCPVLASLQPPAVSSLLGLLVKSSLVLASLQPPAVSFLLGLLVKASLPCWIP